MNMNIPTQTIAPQDPTEIMEPSPEATEVAVATLGSAFHEDWRKTRLNEDGSFDPRVKPTKDSTWIDVHGTDQVDIANSTYAELPEDWKAENKAAAEVIVGIFNAHNGNVDLTDLTLRAEVGDEVHIAWLSRNEWAKGGDLDVPFTELPEDEQAKDLDQVAVAQQVFSRDQRAVLD